jgi:hypothetical protein
MFPPKPPCTVYLLYQTPAMWALLYCIYSGVPLLDIAIQTCAAHCRLQPLPPTPTPPPYATPALCVLLLLVHFQVCLSLRL